MSYLTLSRPILLGLIAAGLPGGALAHTRERPVPENIWSAWNLDPLIVIPLLLVTWLYLRGLAARWRRVGQGHGISRLRGMAFLGGVGSIVVAVVSPLDALGAALFSAHMTQHLLLFLVAPMLLALGRPFTALPWALPASSRKSALTWAHRNPVVTRTRPWLDQVAVVWIAFTTALWIWHVPALYDAALRSNAVHAMEHLTFLVAAFLFWSWLMRPAAGRRSRNGLAILVVFTSVMQSGVLGALLTFAPSPLYEGHLPYTAAWGLTPLEDQQLAGLLMWIPMGLWFTATTIVIFIAWLGDADRSVRRWERDELAPVEGR